MIVNGSELSKLRHDLDSARIALRLGTYDILHAGHLEGINYAASQADVLAIGIMPDGYVRRQKGLERPIHSEKQRMSLIDSVEQVDYSFVVPGTTLGLARTIRALKPDIYVEGMEHSESQPLIKRGFFRFLGLKYIVDDQNCPESTSLMVAKFGIEGAMARSNLAFSFAQQDTA